MAYGLVGKLQGVGSIYIGILSNDTEFQYSLYRAAGNPGSQVRISGGLTHLFYGFKHFCFKFDK